MSTLAFLGVVVVAVICSHAKDVSRFKMTGLEQKFMDQWISKLFKVKKKLIKCHHESLNRCYHTYYFVVIIITYYPTKTYMQSRS